MISVIFLYILVTLSKSECHILIGTPKEVVALSIVRAFCIETISMCILDDADVINTTNLVQSNILLKLTNCQKVLVSSTSLHGAMTGVDNCEFIKDNQPKNTMQFVVKCQDVPDKINAIIAIYKALKACNGKGFVFMNVSYSISIVYFKKVSIVCSSMLVDSRRC